MSWPRHMVDTHYHAIKPGDIILPWDDRDELHKTISLGPHGADLLRTHEWFWRIDVGEYATESASGFPTELWKAMTPCHPECDDIRHREVRLGINQYIYYTWFATTCAAAHWRTHLAGIDLDTCTLPWRIRQVPARAFKDIYGTDIFSDPLLGKLGMIVYKEEYHLNPPQVGPNQYISTEGCETFMSNSGGGV